MSGQVRSGKPAESDSLTYDMLVDDYLLMAAELDAARDSLGAERTLRALADTRAERCEKDAKVVKKRVFWVGVKDNLRMIGFGLVVGFLVGKVI